MAVTEERALSTAYRTTTRVRRPEGQGLNDLYVRFFRMAERRIAEKNWPGNRVLYFKLFVARRIVFYRHARALS